jgi:hypothetical protein
MKSFSVGDPADPKISVGPMVSQNQYDRVQSYIRKGIEEGAGVLVGGEGHPEGLEAGYFVKPTVFVDVKNDMAIAQEEIFGPVLSVIAYDSEDDAIRIANDSKYGLHAAVIGADLKRARLVPKGRVVTAFTSISSALIRDPASSEKPTVFTCADDEAARSTVIALAKEIGFEGVDAGHLDASPNIENLGLLVGQLAYGSGFGNRVTLRAYVAPRPVRRARPGKGSTVPKRRRNP